jgi:hypothetical protein
MVLIEEKYYDTVSVAVAAAAGIGAPGLLIPGLDMAGVGTTWTVMILGIAKISGHELNAASAAKIATAAIGAVSGYMLGSKILTWAAAPLILTFPVAGVPAAILVNATLNGLFTLKLGCAAAKQLSRPEFNALDIMDLATSIASLLTPVPSSRELQLVREMLGY